MATYNVHDDLTPLPAKVIADELLRKRGRFVLALLAGAFALGALAGAAGRYLQG